VLPRQLTRFKTWVSQAALLTIQVCGDVTWRRMLTSRKIWNFHRNFFTIFTKSIKFTTSLFGWIQSTHSYGFFFKFNYPSYLWIHLCGLFTHFSDLNFCPFSIFHFMLPDSPVSHSSLINHPNNTCWAQIMKFFLPQFIHLSSTFCHLHPGVHFIPDSFFFLWRNNPVRGWAAFLLRLLITHN